MSLAETALQSSATPVDTTGVVYRIDVLPLTASVAERISHRVLGDLYVHPVYWLKLPEPQPELVNTIAENLLVDPILQRYAVSSVDAPAAGYSISLEETVAWVIEKQFLPGVTDNLGTTVQKSIPLLFPDQALPPVQVASGQVYLGLEPEIPLEAVASDAEYTIFNPLVERITVFQPEATNSPEGRYRFPEVKGMTTPSVETVSLAVFDSELMAISQRGNLALTLDEMKAIQSYFGKSSVQALRAAKGLPEWPTDVELEIIAQTWSEHCKHKIFSANITYTDASDPDFPFTSEIHSLFKTYIVGSTERLKAKRTDLLSVFKDNAGVLAWDDNYGVCFKVETHNSPSALEPYGGALTGIVGVNRDILGTGLGAKPLFNTDVFCFAHPDECHLNRPTMLPAASILQGVRKGVEDGGNKSGIPTVNGSLFFDPRFRAKPLVFCGTGGLLPLEVDGKPGYGKFTKPGDTIMMAGGRVGKDGIHGATFSSEALNQDSPVSAVQIGDPLAQKRLLDFQMVARDRGLITGITDNGAGGLSSSVGEMAEMTGGATIHLDRVPLKYPGLAPFEIVISESQERMTISTDQPEALKALAEQYDVEVSDIGTFHTEGTFDVVQGGTLVASLDLEFLHNGLPPMQLKALWTRQRQRPVLGAPPKDATPVLLNLLKRPNICSREALIRQYDHEVQGRSVIKPLMGPHQTAPCDAAVIQPVLGDNQGLVVSNGLCPQYSDWDTYHMATCAVDEAVRNAVAVGADPASIALLDNFCWPDPLPSKRNPDADYKLAQLVRANKALYDITLSYETPLISGKDSMKNDFDDGTYRISIPPTLLVSAIGKIPDIHTAVSMEFKAPGDVIFLLGRTNMHMGGSEYYAEQGWYSPYCPQVNIPMAKRMYRLLHQAINKGWIRSCHDLSEGGIGVALAESALGSNYGATVSLNEVLHDSPELRWDDALFSETPSRFVLTVDPAHVDALKTLMDELPLLYLGTVTELPTLDISFDRVRRHRTVVSTSVEALRKAWRKAPASCYEGGMMP